MTDVLLDALIDSLKVLAILVVVYFLLALLSPKLSLKLSKKNKFTPLLGVSLGLLPQCGFSVAATDLYEKRKLSAGTLLGIYIATSDEALPVFLAHPEKAIMILPLLAIKFVLGIIVAYTFDWISAEKTASAEVPCETSGEMGLENFDCCLKHGEKCSEHHAETTAENNAETTAEDEKQRVRKAKLRKYLFHPLVHSLKIFIYVLIINIIFGTAVFYIGEAALTGFLSANKFFAPILAVLVGLIPNCASSVIITDLYILGGLGFGATVAGLCANAGLGLMVLFKSRAYFKEKLLIVSVLIAVSLIAGYAVSLILFFK